MREIKFKAWDKENKEMMTFRKIDFELGQITVGSLKGNYGWNDRIDKFILLQYTGLKDKDGVEIYEGDIIELDEKSSVYDYLFRLVVQWDKNGFNFQPKCIWKVVGNIYEN